MNANCAFNLREILLKCRSQGQRGVSPDLSVVASDDDIFYKKDFIRTENYIIRLKEKAVEKLVNELNQTFSNTVKYKNKNYQWSTIIDIKARELANYLLGKTKSIDLSKPNYKLDREDNNKIRDLITNISYSEWKKLGFSKGSLHYLKQNARSDEPFKIYGKMREKLESLN